MGLLSNVLGSSVPGGSLAKPLCQPSRLTDVPHTPGNPGEEVRRGEGD